MKSIVSVFLALALCIAMVGCGTQQSNLVLALNAVSDAASVAVIVTSTMASLGKVSPEDATLVAVYAQSVSGAIQSTITELNSTDPNPQKIVTISAVFAKIAAPAINKDKAPQIAAAVDAVAATVSLFLNHLTSAGVLKVALAVPNTQIVLAPGDKALLKQIREKSVQTYAKATELKN